MVRVANELQMTAEFWEGCCKLPQMYPQHRKIRQEPTSSDDFHTIPIHFIQNIYKLSPMKVCQWLFEFDFFFFSFCSPFWWAEGKIRHMNILLSGWKTLWLISRLTSHSASREESGSVYTLQWHSIGFLRNFQQFQHLHYCLHYRVVIFHSLSEKNQLWGIKCRWREKSWFWEFQWHKKVLKTMEGN